MKKLKLLIVQAIALLAWDCCLADSAPIITVRVNNQMLQIALPKEHATQSSIQRIIVERVQREIINLAVQKYNITVPQETLSHCMDLYIVAGGENPVNLVDVIAKRSETTIKALRMVVVDHDDKDNVYDKYLSGVMSRSEWETWLKSNDSPEKIDKLESLVPHSVADLKRFSQNSLKSDMEMWLLFHKLTKEVSPSSDEIQLLYKKKYPAGIPLFSEVKNEIKAEATKQLREAFLNKWWREQLIQSNVVMPIEYQGVNELLKNTPNLHFLPVSITTTLEKM